MNQINTTGTSPLNSTRWVQASKMQAVNKLIKLKNDKGPWEVIAEIIRVWVKEKPEEYRSFVIGLDETKRSRKVSSVGGSYFSGVTKDKSTGGRIRYLCDIPVKVIKMIRVIYTPDELPMDKKFYNKFGRLFPDFKISEKI